MVIDKSSGFRMDPKVPLVVPEVNPEATDSHNGIVANPNCSTIQFVAVLKPLLDAVGLEHVTVSTYQAVSGTGTKAMDELTAQTRAVVAGEPVETTVYPHQIAFNVLPHCDVFDDDGNTQEETKLVRETRKILSRPDLPISATCVRVPVWRGHSEAVWIETTEPLSPDEARRLLAAAPGVDRGRRSRHQQLSHAAGCRRRGSGVRRPHPSGRVPTQRLGAVGGGRQPPQGRRHQRHPDRRAAGRAQPGPGSGGGCGVGMQHRRGTLCPVCLGEVRRGVCDHHGLWSPRQLLTVLDRRHAIRHTWHPFTPILHACPRCLGEVAESRSGELRLHRPRRARAVSAGRAARAERPARRRGRTRTARASARAQARRHPSRHPTEAPHPQPHARRLASPPPVR